MGHEAPQYTMRDVVDRFVEKTKKNANGCVEWTARLDRHGYGRFGMLRADGQRRPMAAHRVSYMLFVGDYGDLHVLHKCDNPKCVNPTHLFLGTNGDNVRDAVQKGRHRAGNLNVKLTKADAEQIRKLRDSGRSAASIARQFGLDRKTVYRIVVRKIWK